VSEDIVNGWDVDAMANWLRKENLHDCVRPFLLKKINGFSFLVWLPQNYLTIKLNCI